MSGMRKNSVFGFMLATASVSALSLGQPAFAANSAGASANAKSGALAIEQVVVTAQRRTQLLSRVPIADTAFTASDLQQRSISNTNELQSLVPGLTMITTDSSNEFDYAIRGQTLQAFSGSPPGVLAYMNDVPLSPHNETSGPLYDLAGIEVLKGPQGTLFGRNATGGAILYKTAQPTDTFGGYVKASGGSYNMAAVQGAVNIPVLPGLLDLRIAGSYQRQDGYVKNVLNNTTLGDIDNKSIRVTAKVTPTNALTSTFLFQYDQDGGTEAIPQIFSSYVPGQTNNGYPLTALAYILTGGAQAHYAALAKQNPYEEYLLYTGPHKARGMFLQNTTSYDINPDMQIKNIAGFVYSNAIISNQLNASPYIIMADLNPAHCCDGLNYVQSGWSEELQLIGNSSDNKLKYIFGFFASYNGERNIWPFDFAGFAYYWRYKTTDYSKALYSQETYDLSDLTGIHGLSITGGFRYTWEDLGVNQLPGGINYNPAYPLAQSMSESAPSWQVGLKEQLTNETMLYVVTRGSWRAGGYNDGSSANNANAFGMEKTHDVEAGVKFSGKLLGHPVQATGDVYSQWNDNYQTTLYTYIGGNPGVTTVNVKSALTQGLELSFDGSVNSWLLLGGNAAFTSANFTNPYATGGGYSGRVTNFADSPHFSASLYAMAYLPVPEAWGDMSLRADTYTVSKTPFSNFVGSVIPDSTLPGYTTLNLRYQWDNIFGSSFSFAAYGKNVLNRFHWLGGFPLGFLDGTNTAIPAPPATFGIQVGYKF